MSDNHCGPILPASEDRHLPDFSGSRLRQLQADWIAASRPQGGRRFESVEGLQSIALIGAVRHHETGRLNLRDEIACRAIMRQLIPHVPLTPSCKIEFYNLAEHTDIFVAGQPYDLAIFCNLREVLPSLQAHYAHLKNTGDLAEVLNSQRDPVFNYGHDLNRVVADALKPSEVLSGIRFSDIPQEHANYVTISEQAMQPGAYRTLMARLQPRFVAAWGFEQFIHGGHFTEPARYDLSRSPGQRLLQRNSFSPAHHDRCSIELIEPFESKARQVMPRPPQIDLAIRNDVMESITTNDKKAAGASILFGQGVKRVESLDLLARIQEKRGREAVADSGQIKGRSVAELRTLLEKPPTFLERMEKRIRHGLSG